MKKLYIILLISIALASVSVVSAADYVSQDFDGFSADIPKNADIEKTVDGDQISYSDKNERFSIWSVHDSEMNADKAEAFYSHLVSSGNYELLKTDGKITYFKAGPGYVAGTYDDGILVFVISQDEKLVDHMVKSVEFTN